MDAALMQICAGLCSDSAFFGTQYSVEVRETSARRGRGRRSVVPLARRWLLVRLLVELVQPFASLRMEWATQLLGAHLLDGCDFSMAEQPQTRLVRTELARG